MIALVPLIENLLQGLLIHGTAASQRRTDGKATNQGQKHEDTSMLFSYVLIATL